MRKPMKIRQNTRPQNRGPINKKEAGMGWPASFLSYCAAACTLINPFP